MLADLPTSVPELQALVLEESAQLSALQEEYGSLKQRYNFIIEQFKLAQQRRFARSSESNVLQQEMQFDEADAVPAEELPKEDNTITRSGPDCSKKLSNVCSPKRSHLYMIGLRIKKLLYSYIFFSSKPKIMFCAIKCSKIAVPANFYCRVRFIFFN